MDNTDHKATLIEAFRQSLISGTFVKLSLGHYNGTEENLKNIYIKKILIKREEKLSFTYRYKTKDEVKNYTLDEGKALVQGLIAVDRFRVVTLMTTEADHTFEYLNTDKATFKKKSATHTEAPSPDHDRQKHRLIASHDKPYLTALRITDEAGNVYKATQDKYRQINHYIEILSTLLRDLPQRELLRVVDMGAGKGYLTFALYDYLTDVLKVNAEVTGVEYRADLVTICEQIAEDTGLKGLHFTQSTIEEYDCRDANVLIALHACDTATDDAIYKGITAGADLIVAAPCCHKQIRREIEKHKTKNELDYLTRHGIFLERQAEMITDGIRALILEYFGYPTKIFEFISDAHTPKNIMLVGVKNPKAPPRSAELLSKIKAAKAYFGIEQHYLEKLMEITT